MVEKIPVLLMVRALHLGGAERDMTRLAVGLDRDRWEPHVACFIEEGVRGDELRAACVPIVELPVRSFKNSTAIAGARAMRRYIREHGIRVLQALDVPASIFGVPVAKLAGVDAVIPCALGHRELYPRMERTLLRVSDRLGDRLIVNSQALIDHLVAGGVIAREKTALVYNGIDVEAFRPPADAERRRDVLPEEFRSASVVVGSIAALRPEKSLQTVIAAFARMAEQDSGARLVLVGGGPERERLGRLAVEAGIADRTHFEPFTSDVRPWLHALDVFVLSSLSESFPNALLEAMACGTAAVSSRVGGAPELAGEDRALTFEAGDVEALADRLTRLASDPSLRERLARTAREFVVRELPVERFVASTAAVYEDVLREKAKR